MRLHPRSASPNIALMLSLLSPAFGRPPRLADLRRSPHFDGEKFQNPVPTHSLHREQLPDVLRRSFNRQEPRRPGDGYRFGETHREELQRHDEIQVNWLGHAALLLHKAGRYFLLDPVLSERVSPFPFMGPQRFFPSPIAVEDLPPLEAILLSHDHYDHCDSEVLPHLAAQTQHYVAPLGLRASLEYWGIPAEKITELDWGEGFERDGYHFIATPARHFSGRGLKRDHTLWCSYVMQIGEHRLFWAGDTGVFMGLADIGEQYGPFELALMPIGAYDEAWHDIHLNPEEAWEAFEWLEGGRFFPTHWGTLDLSLHTWPDPMQRLLAAAGDKPLLAPEPGRWVSHRSSEVDPRWWERFVR